jgi:hypothetical protein
MKHRGELTQLKMISIAGKISRMMIDYKLSLDVGTFTNPLHQHGGDGPTAWFKIKKHSH